MSLQDDLAAASSAFPAPLRFQKDCSLAMEAPIAERKAFLSERKLTYKCRLRMNDDARSIIVLGDAGGEGLRRVRRR
jgi:hypothetical protein